MSARTTRPDRTTILYVIIDRPAEVNRDWNGPNIDGLKSAAAAFDRELLVEVVTLAELQGKNGSDVDAQWRPLAIFSAGSWTEWYQYGADATWHAQLESYFALVRTTTIPMLAVCGSHQLVAAAFNGFGAVAHLSDNGPLVMVWDELRKSPPRSMAPSPRVSEVGTYPVAATSAASSDPIVSAAGLTPMTSVHHADQVTDTTGFVLLYQGDPSRAPATSVGGQVKTRCHVHGMKLDRDDRLLYSVQFHPEIPRFSEATADDAGFGQRFLVAFLGEARRWWTEGAGAPMPIV